jgi:flagellar assembly protein FliH
MAPQKSRPPEFLARAAGRPAIEPAHFRGSSDRGAAVYRRAMTPVPAREERMEPRPEPAPPPGPSAEAVALAAARQKLETEFGQRIAGALEVLRSTAERLAADVRSEALELALLVARRILEAELGSGVEPLVAIIRSTVRRLGESRRIVVRLAPADAEIVGGSAGLASRSLSAAQIEVLADPALSRGDCLVEGDLGTVDGRLSVRLEEVRRALLAVVTEDRP